MIQEPPQADLFKQQMRESLPHADVCRRILFNIGHYRSIIGIGP
jgi:hypothetical protein